MIFQLSNRLILFIGSKLQKPKYTNEIHSKQYIYKYQAKSNTISQIVYKTIEANCGQCKINFYVQQEYLNISIKYTPMYSEHKEYKIYGAIWANRQGSHKQQPAPNLYNLSLQNRCSFGHQCRKNLIKALNNVQIDGKIIKAYYGTTKYCTNFLQNKPCKKDCSFLHQLQQERQINNIQMVKKYTQQQSLSIINQNLKHYIVQFIQGQAANKATTPKIFPTVQETLLYLVETGKISSQKYNFIREQVISQKQKKEEKSNSLTTQSTPIKLKEPVEQFKPTQPNTLRSNARNHKNRQPEIKEEELETDRLSVNKKIRKKLANEYLGKNNQNVSKFSFAVGNLSDADKIKAIVRAQLLKL